MGEFWYHERALNLLVTVSELASSVYYGVIIYFLMILRTRLVVAILTEAAAATIIRIDMDGVLC